MDFFMENSELCTFSEPFDTSSEPSNHQASYIQQCFQNLQIFEDRLFSFAAESIFPDALYADEPSNESSTDLVVD